MGSLRDKYLNKYTIKQEDEEKEKSSYGKKPTVGSDNSGSSVRSSMMDKYVGSGEKEDITSDSISTFFLDAEDYLSNAKARYSKIGVSTASDAWNKNRQESNNLLARGYSIRDYLNKNKESIDEKSYKAMIKQLDSIDDALRGYTGAFRDARQYYSQWESDEEYLKWKKETEEYEALKNFDVQKGEREISDLEKVLNDYLFNIRNATSENDMGVASEIYKQYGDSESIKALIAEKKQYLNRAKHIQEGITLAGVIENDDFKEYSGYVSTKTDDRWSRLTSDFGMGYEDLTYEYINGEENGMRQEIIGKALAYDHDTDKFFVYDHMTEDQISTYNYYYAKDGKEAAEKYLDSIQETLNYQAASERYEKMEGKTALELMFGIEAGVDQFQSGMKNLFNTEDDYIAQTATQMVSGMVREDLADNGPKLPDWLGGASLAQAGYDAITTTSNMAPSVMTSTVLNIIAPGSGAVVGTAMMGASAAGNAYQEMLNLGYDKSQARVYSTLVGASEAGLQYLMGGISNLGGKLTGNALAKMMNGIDNAFLRTALQLAGNMASEGLEEGLQEILTPWFQNLIMHTDENVNWSEVAYSTLLGALTAGVMEGPTTIGDAVSIRNTGKQLQNADISATRLAEIGKTFSADTVAYQLAGRVNENTGAYTMGRLFNEIGATLSEQNITEITNALMAKGMDESTAKKNAKALAYVVEGGQLTDRQIAVIESNEVLAEVARTTLIDANTTWNQRTNALKALADEMTAPKASRTNPAQQSQENTPTTDTVGTQNKEGAQSLSEAVDTGPAKVQTISKIENGQVTVKLEDGTEVNVKQADLSVDDGVRIETIAKLDGISATDANFILNTLRTNTNASAQMDSLGAREAYKYGFYGFSNEHMTTHGVFSNSLTEAQRKAIYETGRSVRQRQVEAKQATVAKNATTTNKVSNKVSGRVHFEGDHSKLTERQSASLTAMEKVADVLGVQIYVFESKLNERGKRVGANGWYDPKDSSIHIDLHAGENGAGTMLFTAAHELTHHIRKWSPAKFKALSDFLMQEYGKKGVNVDALVREQMNKAKRNGRTISYDTAYEEVVADSMEMMLSDGNVLKRLEKLKAQDKDLWHKIKSFIDELAAKIKAVYKGMAPDSVEGRHVADMGKAIYRLQELFAEGLVDASENYQSSLTPGEEGVVVNENGDPVAYSTEDGSVLLSMRTYEEDGREAFRKYLQKCVSSKKLTKAEMQEMMDGIEDIYVTCKEFKDKYAPFSSWSDAAVVRDTYGKPVFSVVTPNGDYKMNLDFSLVCKKRKTLDAVFNEMSRRGIIDDFELGQKSVVKINEIIRKHGLETACALCFVDAKRFRQASMADSFTNLYNELVLSLVPEAQRSSIDYFNFSGYETIKKVEDGIHTWDKSKLDFSHLDEVMKNYGKGTVEHKAAKYIKSHAEGRKLLLRGDFMSSQGFDAVKTQNKDILKLYNSKKGTGGPKAAFGDVQYMNEIIKKAKSWTPAKAYAVGGVRIQSFSDYVPRMVFDYVQMIYDLAATNLPAHAYTKEALFVKQFGLTGVKINMSLIPAIAEGGVAPGLDANGNYVWAGESFDFETAKEIQNAEGYTENCGTICVGVSDRHIRKLLSDPDIRMVIPYHKSGLNPIVAHMNKIAEFTDYTNKQNTTVKGTGAKAEKHFDFNKALHDMGENADPKAVIQQYFDWCDDNGYDPKFADFRDHPNYYKLIEDFTLYDKDGKYVPQREVKAVFPKEGSAFGSMKELIEAGLEEDAVIEGKRDSSLNSIVDEIQKTLPRTEAEIAEEQVAQADKDLEADVKLSDRDSDGNQLTEDQQEFFKDSKVRDSKGNLIVLYHGTSVFDNITEFRTRAYKANRAVGLWLSDSHHLGALFASYMGDEYIDRNMETAGDVEIGNQKKGGVYKLYANLTNPLVVDALVTTEENFGGTVFKNYKQPFYYEIPTPEEMKVAGEKAATVSGEEIATFARAHGYDGVIIKNVKEGYGTAVTDVIAFEPNQVKYADNRTPTSSTDIRYSDRDTESVSNRSLLANAFEGVAQNDIERQKIQEYKGKISLIEAEERKLQKLNEQIKDLSFSKGPKDTKAIRDLQFQAKQTANRISTYDKQLLVLEASKPLQNVLTREKKMAYQRAEKKGKEALEAYREKTMKTQRELLTKWQESRKKGIESRQKTAMRHKIKDVVNELNQYLLKGTKDRHVPESLQKAVAEALDAVNMDTVGAEERIAKLQAELMKAKTPEQIQEISRKIDHIREMGDKMNGRLKKLKDAYDDLLKSPDMNTVSSYDEVIHNKLESVIDKIGNTPLRDMTLAQLEDVYDMYRMVLKAIRDVNKSFKDAKKQSISTRANAVMAQVEEVGGKHKLSLKMLNGIKKFGWNNLKPVYAFEHIGSITLTEAFKNVRAGEDVWALDVTEAREFYLDKSKKYQYDSWDLQKQYKFQSTTGMDFSLNLEQILSLYAYSKRDQAADHLKYGGIVFDESTKIIKKTKMGISLEFNPTEATAYNISEETLADIISKLTDEQKAFANEMQDYLSTVMGAKGNEVTMAMYDIKLFKDKNYFPLKSAQQFMEKARDQQKGEVKIKNSGFSKETVPHAKNPIVLTPFMEVWSNHVNEMSMYHAFVLPLEDFYRIYNYKTPSNNETLATEGVNQYIQNAYGRGATAYIDQLLKDLNGGARTDPTADWPNKLMGRFKKGAVFASLSVVVQQPSAIARAAALVDTKYFIGPKVDHKKHKALWDEVKQYAPVAVIKEMGYFDTNMGKSTQDFIMGKEYSGFKEKMKALVTDSNYRDEILSKAPALADELAWCSIWEAVKRETKAKNPGMDTKSEAFLKRAGERFTEVITKTQVYDSVLSRSAMMRSKDTLMKMATAFMAEPTTSINMVADALLQGKRGNKKYARGAIGAVIASQILNSILVSFVYAGRDDDEDETYWEKYLGTLSGQALDSLNPAGYIPFIKDIMSIVQGYDVERSDMAVISDLWKAWENLSKDNVSPYRKVEGFAGSIAQIFGLPVKNIMRDARGIYQTINSFVNGQQTTKAGIGYAVKGAITGKTVANDQQLYEAILSGDQAQIARVKGRFEDQSSINSAIRKALRANDPRIREAAIAWNANDLDEYMRIAKQIIAEKHFVQDDVVMAIRAEANALTPDDGTSSTSKAKGLFTAEKFAEAIAQGDQATANAIKLDIIQTAQNNGKTEEEAEKSFANSAKGDLKELYLAGTLSEAKAIQALTTYCDETQNEAEQRVAEWAFEDQYGFKYDDKKQQFMDGNISASELKNLLMQVEGKTDDEANSSLISYTRDAYEDGFFDRSKAADVMVTYGGLTEEEADSKLRYIDVKKQIPDTYVDDAWVEEYYKEIESSGISIEVFVDYRNQVKSITGEGKKERRMAVINSMPISNAQKDALYYAEGWAASRLYEAPWR